MASLGNGSSRNKVNHHVRVEHEHAVEIWRTHFDHAQVEGRLASSASSARASSECIERKRNARAASETRVERETRLEGRLDRDKVEVDRRLKQH